MTYFFDGRVSNRFYCTKISKFMCFKLSGTVRCSSETVLIETSILRQLANSIKL